MSNVLSGFLRLNEALGGRAIPLDRSEARPAHDA
jgi:hypothetical protein